ncbi:MAG: cell wall hydrolase [Geminicoccaceae bacterium]|nr:cell wall hydrolase [Geminicoccaceae bacterium]
MGQRKELLAALAGAVLLTIGSPAEAADAEDCLARAVYFEARDDGTEGMAAVAAVVMNRVRHPEFPDDVCAVVKEGGETPPCQFSWWCDGKSDQPEDAELWALAREVAAETLDGETSDPVADALFFHSEKVDPPYHETRELVATVGSHLFYR